MTLDLMVLNLAWQGIWSTYVSFWCTIYRCNLTEPKIGEAQENGKSPVVWKLARAKACKSLHAYPCTFGGMLILY